MNTRIGLASLIAGFLLLGSQAALAEGDAAKGEKIYKKCKACHSLEAGKKKAYAFSVKLVPGRGHFLHMEDPHAFNELLEKIIVEIAGE